MPELPEVETVRAGLAPALTHATIKSVEIFDVRSLKRHLPGPIDFVQTLVGARILAVVRRGKFLWLPLQLAGDNNPAETSAALVGHLGMSGQMLLRLPGAEPDRCNRVTMLVEAAGPAQLSNGDAFSGGGFSAGEPIEFRFIDQRIFGSLAIDRLINTSDAGPGGFQAEFGPNSGLPAGTSSNADLWWLNRIPETAAHISRDALDPSFDVKALAKRLSNKQTGIKRALLDQQLISGVGNIYADEALWATKLHYDQNASSISAAKVKELFANVVGILQAAVAQGGTSFDDQYKNVNGESGYFSVSLNAYGQTGQPCKRCGTLIKREQWANRGSHFCPRCQKLKP
jgi:formamidopyrimidine-DNA glycosylase